MDDEIVDRPMLPPSSLSCVVNKISTTTNASLIEQVVTKLCQNHSLCDTTDCTLIDELRDYCNDSARCAPLEHWNHMMHQARKMPHTRHYVAMSIEHLMRERQVDGMAAFVGGSHAIGSYRFCYDAEQDCDVAETTLNMTCFVDRSYFTCAFDLDIVVPLSASLLQRMDAIGFAQRSVVHFLVDDDRLFDCANFQLIRSLDGEQQDQPNGYCVMRARLLKHGLPSSHMEFTRQRLRLRFPIGKVLGQQTSDLPRSVDYRATVCRLPSASVDAIAWKSLVVASQCGIWIADGATVTSLLCDGGQVLDSKADVSGAIVCGNAVAVGEEDDGEACMPFQISSSLVERLSALDPKEIQRLLGEAELKC